MKRIFLILLLAIIILPSVHAALGISPAIKRVDFAPGQEIEYTFNVMADPGVRIEVYSKEEFAELVKFDRTSFVGSGRFTVKLKLPMKIEKPGKHRLLIGAREAAGEEGGGIGTSIAVQVPIYIIVPYAGKYAEVEISGNNANAGENLNFQVSVASMGSESISASANIDIYSNKEKIETLDLGVKDIKNQESATFRKMINSSIFNHGMYEAVANVRYDEGKIANASLKFKIGYLFVNITNYTEVIIKEGIQPYYINIESFWNNAIENVYGEVYILKNKINITNFLTPSIKLDAMGKDTLRGYIETGKLETGAYNLKINLNYEGESTSLDAELKVRNKINIGLYIVIGAIILIALILAIIVYYLKKLKS